MEEGRNKDPGSLSAEDELTLLDLDRIYRNDHAHEIIPSRAKEWTFYLMAHRSPGPTDIEDPDYNPNHYMFFAMGPKEQRVKDKVFILFLGEETGNYARVVNVEGLKALDEERDLSEDDLFNNPKHMQEFWKMVKLQGQLGSSVPNDEDMEDFKDIVNSWDFYQETKPKG